MMVTRWRNCPNSLTLSLFFLSVGSWNPTLSSEMGLVNTIAFLAVSLAAAKTSQFIRATFNAQYYKVEGKRSHDS